MFYTKLSLLSLLSLLFGGMLFGQAPLKPAALVEYHHRINEPFTPVDQLLAATEIPLRNRPGLSDEVSRAERLSFDATRARQIGEQAPLTLTLTLPTPENGTFEVELVRVDLFTPDFVLRTAAGPQSNVDQGTHYRGIVRGRRNSIAAFSFFDEQVSGLFSLEGEGTFVVGPLGGDNPTREHILYRDADLLGERTLDLKMPDGGRPYTPEELQPRSGGRDLTDCIRIYYEVDYSIWQDKGNGTFAFVSSEFNEVATLYANESINLELKEVFILNNAQDAYTPASVASMLSEFQARTSSINGADLGQLLTYSASIQGGRAASFSGLCASNVDNSLSISDINGAFNQVPTYSWDVYLQAHEFGHLFGSRHTHACVWNGNGTAIDGCSGFTEGSCPIPANPSGGGTIMSYCHQVANVGIDFTQGFGPQPGEVIRNSVINANCLSSCSGGGGCLGSVSNFPYTEYFEGGIDWTQSGSDDIDWSQGSGGTLSSNTGPSNAVQGSGYIYLETSGSGSPFKNATLVSPCFDLSQLANPEIRFQYHAYGATIGTLRLEATTDGSNWTQVWWTMGNQGVDWIPVTLDLSGYANAATLSLRFRAITGESYTGDLALDDIYVGESGGGGGNGNQQYADLPYFTDFEASNLDQFWSTQTSTGAGRVQINFNHQPDDFRHLTMDVGTPGVFSQNEAWLGLRLAGENNVMLEFDWKEFSDETHPQDGVFFSDDGGASFVKVYNLTNGNSTYSRRFLDVSALASANGLTLTNTFIVKFQQYDNNAISVDGMAFDNVSVYSGTSGGGGSNPSDCAFIDFDRVAINPFDPGQDRGSATVLDNGSTLLIENDAWKFVPFNYSVGPATILEFEFRSTSEGEIHGIGLDNNNSLSSNFTFKLYGTQNWGITNYDNYTPSGWTSYSIPLAFFFVGNFDRIVFVADNDIGGGNNSYFRNVRVYEGGSCASYNEPLEIEHPDIEVVLGDQPEFALDLYPLPVVDRLVTAFTAEEGDCPLTLTDLSGKTVLRGTLRPGEQAHDLSALPPGMYLLTVDLGNHRRITRKVVKQ
ncbi:MAG: M12 family metallo-peptidase [Bacteroidota bacterium]